jgi:hypothetical protein
VKDHAAMGWGQVPDQNQWLYLCSKKNDGDLTTRKWIGTPEAEVRTVSAFLTCQLAVEQVRDSDSMPRLPACTAHRAPTLLARADEVIE